MFVSMPLTWQIVLQSSFQIVGPDPFQRKEKAMKEKGKNK